MYLSGQRAAKPKISCSLPGAMRRSTSHGGEVLRGCHRAREDSLASHPSLNPEIQSSPNSPPHPISSIPPTTLVSPITASFSAAMAAMACTSLLLPSTLTLPCSSSSRPTSTPSTASLAARRTSTLTALIAPRWRAGRVVRCEVAVELGGNTSRSSKAEAGARIRVLGPLKVYHVPKNPELDIGGMEGEVKEVVTTFKGKPVSATFPYKVQFNTADGRKFFAHLKDDEFEIVE